MAEHPAGRVCTYLPDDGDPEPIEALLGRVWRKRFTAFVTLFAEINREAPKVCSRHGFIDAAVDVMSAPSDYRRELAFNPAFNTWVWLGMRAMREFLLGRVTDLSDIEDVVAEFASLIERCDTRPEGEPRTIEGTHILVQRFDIDPLIARVTPPSYTFSQEAAEQRRLNKITHSTAFFTDVTNIVVGRIARTWPECHRYLKLLVRVLGYLPDADFRSCSASRYTGVVYLSSRDNSILDMEESLVHEVGHQLLYTVAEVDAFVRDDAEPGDYTLPWSGRVRDFYGYFHAFYIYVLLAQYLGRVAAESPSDRSADERRRAVERRRDIVKGLVVAMTDFHDNPRFTPSGRKLSHTLECEILRLADEDTSSRSRVDTQSDASMGV